MREKFLEHTPPRGWLARYLDWTSGSEAPAVYHYFVGATILGAAIGRSVWFDKGYYRIYPNMQVLLVGPTGRTRKTTAINLGLSILRRTTATIIGEKTTPEGLLDSLDSEQLLVDGKLLSRKDAVALVSAPEFAVLLGRQKYNEGMTPLLTRLFDGIEGEWEYKTRGKGLIKLNNVTLSMLGASTPDWLVTAIPQDAFGGGFMARLLLVVQENTERCFPIPDPPPRYDDLVDELKRIQGVTPFQVKLTKEAEEWYVMWYTASRKDVPEDQKMAGYHERKPEHMLRLAMIHMLSEGATSMSQEHIVRASRILHFLQQEMLYTFKWIGMRPSGMDQERIIRTLKAAGGHLSHHVLAAKLIFFMNALQFRNSIDMLKQANIVKEHHTPSDHWYELVEEA